MLLLLLRSFQETRDSYLIRCANSSLSLPVRETAVSRLGDKKSYQRYLTWVQGVWRRKSHWTHSYSSFPWLWTFVIDFPVTPCFPRIERFFFLSLMYSVQVSTLSRFWSWTELGMKRPFSPTQGFWWYSRPDHMTFCLILFYFQLLSLHRKLCKSSEWEMWASSSSSPISLQMLMMIFFYAFPYFLLLLQTEAEKGKNS